MALCVVILGDIVSGISIIGPFKTGDAAIDWANDNAGDEDWRVVPLESPEA